MKTLLEAASKALQAEGTLAWMLARPPQPGRKPGCLVIYRRGAAVALAKFAHGDRALTGRMQREQQILGTLWREVPYPLVGAIPRALGSARYGTEGRVALQSQVRGHSLMRYLQGNPRRLERTLDLGLDWLARFHRWQHGLEGGYQVTDRAQPTDFAPVLSALARAGVRLSGKTVSRVTEAYRRLGAGAPQHGDFWPGNVFWAGGKRVWVLDWDGYGQVQQPLYDALHYCTSAGLACLGMTWGSGQVEPFLRLFFTPCRIAHLAAMGVRRVADMIGISGPFHPHLLAYLGERARRALQFSRPDGTVPDLTDWVAMLETAVGREDMVMDGKRTL